MDVILAAIVIGGLYPASLAAFVISFARLRSDLHAGFDRLETRLDNGFDRLDASVDALIATLDRSGRLTNPDSGADD